jgi:Flp pilus assembly protein TadD
LDSATTEFHAAITLSPRLVQAYVALAAVLQEQGRVPEAIAELQQAMTIAPNDPQVAALLRSLTTRAR